MSAYIVSKAHIDAIVTFAVGGARRVGTVKRIAEEGGHGEFVSSAVYTPSQIGAALWAENHASVDYRYSETTAVPPTSSVRRATAAPVPNRRVC